MSMQFDTNNKQQSLASFLITRPPIGYLGFGWESDQKNWDPIFNNDYGTPKTLCSESTSGVFQRQWTSGTVTLDCNLWKATLPPSL
jgi:hypothetical protein